MMERTVIINNELFVSPQKRSSFIKTVAIAALVGAALYYSPMGQGVRRVVSTGVSTYQAIQCLRDVPRLQPWKVLECRPGAQPDDPKEELRRAIASQESGHNYNALNEDSGAMGKYQFLPSTAAMYVTFSSTDEFLNSPDLQERAFDGYLNDLWESGESKGLSGCELAEYVASGWYSGDGDLRESTHPQGKYLSIAAYADSVAGKTSCDQWEEGTSDVGSLLSVENLINAFNQSAGSIASNGGYAFPTAGGQLPTAPQHQFGMRTDPFGSGEQKMHRGIDIQGAIGTPLIAYCDGTINHYRGMDGKGDGFGPYAFYIDCEDSYQAWYGHNDSMSIADGSQVNAGDTVGELGSRGLSTGPHLHFELRKPQPGGWVDHVDPKPYLSGLSK